MINPSTCLRGFLFGLPNVAADSSFFVTSHFSIYSGGKGFYRNNEVGTTGIKTSIACTGTCIEKINDGQSCSRDTQKIMWADPTLIGESGDDDACKSGLCQCGTCASSGKVPDWKKCKSDRECATTSYCDCPSGLLSTCALCAGTCKKKEGPGGKCEWDDDDECKSANCMCGTCTDSTRKHANGQKCDGNGECTSGYCKGNFVTGCLGTCERKRKQGESCNAITGDDTAVSICYSFS